MNVLAGKLRRTNGSLLINGQELEMHRFRKVGSLGNCKYHVGPVLNSHSSMCPHQIIGHVPQSDIMIPELTIRETLMHSASTLLPRTWTKAQIETHVSAIIKTLGLEHVEHSFVGDERVRGIR